MTQSLKLLARIGIAFAVINLVYFAPLVFAAKQPDSQVSDSKNKNMSESELNEHKLEIVTTNFLDAIEDAEALYDSKNFSKTDEVTIRVRLRDAFEEYFATLIPFETEAGLVATDRSREVIQTAIGEFIEADNNRDISTEIALDLDAYSKVMTESLIHTATGV